MAQRIQKQKSKQEDEVQEEAPPPPAAARESLQDIDDLLDEIDEVLETNAAEFVASYVQKGGQ